MSTFSEMDKHYDRHNNGICAVCGCTTWSRWKSVCDACRNENMNLAKDYKNSNAYTCPYCGWDIKVYVDDARVLFEHHMQSHEERDKAVQEFIKKVELKEQEEE